MKYEFESILKKFAGDGPGWMYLRMPKNIYNEIKEVSSGDGKRRGFGAVKVEVKIGNSKWQTSIFPDSEDKSYVLFVKKGIRQNESIELNDAVKATVILLG